MRKSRQSEQKSHYLYIFKYSCARARMRQSRFTMQFLANAAWSFWGTQYISMRYPNQDMHLVMSKDYHVKAPQVG